MLEWAEWFNTRRLLAAICDMPPAIYEATNYREKSPDDGCLNRTKNSPKNPGWYRLRFSLQKYPVRICYSEADKLLI